MTIKQSTASEKNQKIQRVQQEITKLLEHKILEETPEIKQKIQEILTQVNAVKFKNEKSNMLKGKIYSEEEILAMIVEASGYTKWNFSHTETLNHVQQNELKEQYDIDFKEKEINRHMFTRKTNDRSALCAIIVTVLPGLFEVALHTDRVGYGMDGLVDKKQFLAGIEMESDN